MATTKRNIRSQSETKSAVPRIAAQYSGAATRSKAHVGRARGGNSPRNKREAKKSSSLKDLFRPGNKASMIAGLLLSESGATIADLVQATGWQEHSVRGFMSGQLGTKHGISIVSAKEDDGFRRYRAAKR